MVPNHEESPKTAATIIKFHPGPHPKIVPKMDMPMEFE
jgi:hypothetical protein